MTTITTLFFDIGGVCLSNGWDHDQRKQVATQFDFDYDTFESRHHQVVDSLERGQLSLDEYLDWTLCYAPRSFTREDVKAAMFALSTPFPETIALLKYLNAGGRYLMATVNNESRELHEYRVAHFGLRSLFTAFFTSCYLGLIKPQPEHYRRALQITQREPGECLFVDDRPLNVEVAQILGMQTILFKDAAQLERDLRAMGVMV